ncbi:DUF5134 domain-containing protein [Kitasatospora sp. NBC_00458]|uniref:DUF5134 domain-containing protein n=1 Tax=Kitasatospora sp. NBC_00458 TaxID=2903568 RepID=UPI002E188220
MQEPVIATALLIALTGWCAAHCALVVGRRCPDRRLEPTEIVMALAMVAMMAPAFDPLPRVSWACLLAAAAAWPALLLARRVAHRPRAALNGGWFHYPHHILGAAAMAVLMAATAPAHHHSAGGSAHSGAHAAVPEWALLALAAYFLGHAVCGTGALLPRAASGFGPAGAGPHGARSARARGPAALRAPAPDRTGPSSPGLVASRRTVMSIGMVYMLLGMS